MNKAARWILLVLGLLGFGAVFSMFLRDALPSSDVRTVKGYEPWDEETLSLVESLPVQDGGRIKPLSTHAGFTMLKLYGARSMKISSEDGGETIRLKPLPWMLDAFFRPQYAIHQPSFRIEDSDILQAAGLEEVREKRDRYSYAEIEPVRDRLFELAQKYSQAEPEKLTPMEAQTIALARNLSTYEQLLGAFALTRSGVEMMALQEGEESKRTEVSSIMQTADVLREVIQSSQAEGREIPKHVESLMRQVFEGGRAATTGIFLFPPAGGHDEKWLSPGERILNVMTSRTNDVEGSIQDVKMLEVVSKSIFSGEAAFRAAFSELKESTVARATERGEYRSVPLEASYYHKNWFLYAMVWFLIATTLAIAMWLTSGSFASRVLSWLVWLTTILGLVYTVIPIVKRCIIMERPPIGNLYDTIIFICAASVFLGALVELMTRRRIVLGILPIMGVCLILLARLFEVGDAKDHMDPLVAVLRSNYWLTIHVITITLGYAAGLVTAVMSMVYVMLRGLRLDGGDKNLRRGLTRAVYGMVCLTLFLSLVGTVLGGIWANDSWGRFWGWDPKENGALLIVLMTLIILHARLGGYLREWGIHFASIFLAAVVIFSWWGVNLLGVGLHNYGFAEGGAYINAVYAVIGAFIVFGLIAKFTEKPGN